MAQPVIFRLIGIGKSESGVNFQSKKHPVLQIAKGGGARRVGTFAEHFRTSTAARMLQLFSSPWLQLAVTPVTHQRDAAAGSAWQRHLNSGGCRVLALSRDLWPCKSTLKQYNSGRIQS